MEAILPDYIGLVTQVIQATWFNCPFGGKQLRIAFITSKCFAISAIISNYAHIPQYIQVATYIDMNQKTDGCHTSALWFKRLQHATNSLAIIYTLVMKKIETSNFSHVEMKTHMAAA